MNLAIIRRHLNKLRHYDFPEQQNQQFENCIFLLSVFEVILRGIILKAKLLLGFFGVVPV